MRTPRTAQAHRHAHYHGDIAVSIRFACQPEYATWVQKAARGGRGMAIRIILGDRDDESEHIRLRNLRASDESLSARAKIYYWPLEKRLRDQSGNCGLMHAKCAIADREVMFLSSANLTQTALAWIPTG